MSAAATDKVCGEDRRAVVCQPGKRMWRQPVGLRRNRGKAGPEELEQVVGEADEGPLSADFPDAAQPESAKAAPLLDLRISVIVISPIGAS